MALSKDLFLAILSMDSYNRGYGAGISFGENSDARALELVAVNGATRISRAVA